jgi:recombination protein U
MSNGMNLEKRATSACVNYMLTDVAFLHKVPNAVSIQNGGAKLVKSTVDYMGLLKGGRFIAFDAKETELKTRFPLKNIKPHQLDFLEQVESFGGIGFFLVHFVNLYKDEAFILTLDLIKSKWDTSDEASISIEEIKNTCQLVPINDFLKFVK